MKSLAVLFIAFALFASFAVAGSVAAEPPEGPKTGDIWICPSVSTNNPNGMWVIGGHGAYYILKPGTSSDVWPMILNPTANLEKNAPHVEHLAQHTAAKGLYKDLESYPYLLGWAVVLDDGSEFIYEHFGIEIAPMTMVHVMPSDAPIYAEPHLQVNIHLASAVFW